MAYVIIFFSDSYVYFHKPSLFENQTRVCVCVIKHKFFLI